MARYARGMAVEEQLQEYCQLAGRVRRVEWCQGSRPRSAECFVANVGEKVVLKCHFPSWYHQGVEAFIAAVGKVSCRQALQI